MQNIIPIEINNTKKRTITERHIYTQELIRTLKNVEVEQTITYDELSKIIGLDVRPQSPGYSYQHSARAILEREENIAFEVIAKVGLRRLTSEEIAMGTGSIYLRNKKSLIRRSKRRISTVNDNYNTLSDAAKMRVTTHRTILAFDNELSKTKNILKIEGKIKKQNKLIGFKDTLDLFNT